MVKLDKESQKIIDEVIKECMPFELGKDEKVNKWIIMYHIALKQFALKLIHAIMSKGGENKKS